MNLIYKRLEENDIPLCAKEFVLSFQQPPWNEEWTHQQAISRFQQLMSSSTSRGFVIYDNQEVVCTLCGRILTYMDEREFWIDDLSVHPSYQGHGLGTKMLNYLKKEIQEENVTRLMLNTMKDYDCVPFYHRNGFSLEDNMITMSCSIK